MRSPFPGMDPWLESRWSDVHAGLVTSIRAALQPLLPPDLRARAEERVLLETAAPGDLRAYRPDVAVVETASQDKDGAGQVADGRPATVEAVVIEFESSVEVERWVQIIDLASGGRLVTVIEVLSPGNKAQGRLHESYLRKLADCAAAQVSVVEIDLLRGSRDLLPISHDRIPAARRAPYLACVRRGPNAMRWEAYPLALRDPLPAIPIPLRSGEPDVLLPLQPLLDGVYRDGGHDDIDYRAPCRPPLEGEDAAWADALLRSAGRR